MKEITYKGHRITGPDDMLGMYHYHGPAANGGTSSIKDAKRMIDRKLLEPTCPHTKTHEVRAVGVKRPYRVCNRCDKLIPASEPPPAQA